MKRSPMAPMRRGASACHGPSTARVPSCQAAVACIPEQVPEQGRAQCLLSQSQGVTCRHCHSGYFPSALTRGWKEAMPAQVQLHPVGPSWRLTEAGQEQELIPGLSLTPLTSSTLADPTGSQKQEGQ